MSGYSSNFSMKNEPSTSTQNEPETVVVSNPFDDTPTIKNSHVTNPHRMTMMPPRPYCPPPPPPYMNPLNHRGHFPGPLVGPRIYPADQPVIKSANPNAPPIFPCGSCHQEIHDNEQSLFCNEQGYGCSFAFHRKCVGMTEDAYNFLKLNESQAAWVCDSCFRDKRVPPIIFKNP